jgi:alginate O-acetyltransferase complex protein AlgI
MVFSAPSFIFLFLPVALAICLTCYRFGPAWYVPALLIVSIAFYYWSAGKDTLILLGIIALNWAGALVMARTSSGWIAALLIAANLAVLGLFKYAGFFSTNLDTLAGTNLNQVLGGIVLPAGVSFFVFQAISYVIDVRRGDIRPEPNLITYGAYQALFPHLIAGPIVRYRDVIADVRNAHVNADNFAIGVTRFAHGLFKKVVIADGVGPIADAVFALPSGEMDFVTAWLGATAYAMQIYFDFSGYSDMAIGLACMLGIRFPENFDRPYVSRSITEFWRRWHISLSSWFRDYLYIPLGGNRGSAGATYRNLLIVFAATGLWHGAAWTFIIWGLLHGAFLIGERALFRSPTESLSHPALRWLYCLPAVTFAWVVFRSSSLEQAFSLWSAMLWPAGLAPLDVVAERTALGGYTLVIFAAGALIFIVPGRTSLGSRLMREPVALPLKIANLGYTAVALTGAAALALSSGFSPFLYFTF